MHSTADHLNLAPPQQGHWLGPLALALVAHGLLVAALTWGVGWKREAPPTAFEAEIWSRVPQAVAPRAVEPPPPPPSRPPEPSPKPQPVAQPTPPPPGPSQADIATAKAKQQAEANQKKAQAEAAQKAAADKLAQEQAAAVKKAAAEKAEKTAKAAADKAAADKKATAEKERQQQLAQQKREKARELAEEKRLEELAAKERDAQMRRIMGQAGASGGPTATGTAQQASGPSAAYGGRVAARIKPNVVFTDTVSGNPRAEVEVRTLPDGTITTRRIVKSSGSPAWDEAVLRAIDRTGTLPRDTDGRVPSSLIIGLRPQD
jgi:colicin import membrane protein